MSCGVVAGPFESGNGGCELFTFCLPELTFCVTTSERDGFVREQ